MDHLGDKYLTPSMEQPVGGGAVGDTPVSITVIRYQGKLYYRLYVVEDGESERWRRATTRRFSARSSHGGIVKLFGNGCGAVDVSGLGGESNG